MQGRTAGDPRQEAVDHSGFCPERSGANFRSQKGKQDHPVSTSHRQPGGNSFKTCKSSRVNRWEVPQLPGYFAEGLQNPGGRQHNDLLKACKQASIIAREGSNVVRFHLQPGTDQTGKVRLLAEIDETGTSEIEIGATVEGQELEIAFTVKFLQDGLETISTKNVVIEANAHNTPAAIRPTGEEEYLYVLMPMHIDGK